MSEHSLTLSDYCVVNPPRWIPEAITSSDHVSFVPMQDVSETGGWTARQTKKLSEVQAGFTNFKNKDVLIAKITPCFENGKGALVDNLTGNVGFGSTEFHVLRAKENTEPRFIFHLSQWERFRVAALQFMSGSAGQQRVATEFFYKYRVEKFTEGEQSIISNILDYIDTQIHKTEFIIAKLQQVKQGLLHDLLTRGVDENGELRPSYEDAPELYKSSELGWIPKNWEVESIQNLLSTADPAMRSGPFGSALLKSELVEKGIPLLGIDNVFKERFSTEFRRFVTPEKFDELSRYAVRENDLLITIMGTVGRCCLVPKGINKALSSKHTWCISLDSDKYLPYLAMLQVNYAKWVLTHFSKDQQGGTMDAIRSDTLRNTPLPKPPIAEQVIIEKVLKETSLRLASEAEKYDKLKLKKSGLMDDLLTGKKRVTNLLADQHAN